MYIVSASHIAHHQRARAARPGALSPGMAAQGSIEQSPFFFTRPLPARSIYFNVRALPVLAHYRFVEWRVKNESNEMQEAALAPLHSRCLFPLFFLSFF